MRRPLTDESRRFLRATGAAVKELRHAAHLLQEQLGARIGAAGSRIGEIERGHVDFGIARARELAAEFDMPLSAFFRRIEVESQSDAAVSERRDRIAMHLRRLSRRDLDLVDVLLRRLAESPKSDR